MFRITPLSMTRTAMFQNRSHLLRMSHLQYQASSGLKYARPSDDAVETRAIRGLNRALGQLETQNMRIAELQQPLNASVSQLLEANNLIGRAKQIALDAPQTFGDSDRAAMVAEVDSIINRMVAVANSQDQGRFLYSGTATDTRPFELVENPGLAIPHVSYVGSRQNAETVITDSISVRSTFSGAEIFQRTTRGESLFLGATGAAAGLGTSNELGRVNLLVQHSLTTYAAGSGVLAGSDSTGGDTVIGNLGDHRITIEDSSGNGTAGRVSLNGGASVNWNSSNTNLQVTGPQGETVFVDTSAIVAGFSGDIDLAASGTLSTDGGKTTTAIDFFGDQVVHSTVTGRVTNVSSSAIRFAGTESVEFTQTADAITALLELKDDLLNSRQLESTQLNASFERRAVDLETISNQLLDSIGEQSVALQDLEQLSSRNGDHQLELRSRLNEREAADLASVIVEMQSLQSTMQFNYAALSILQSNNLLDFLG
ncbi:MAG: flagellar hook-associated protein FlgL [Pirellulaceae bacterium]